LSRKITWDLEKEIRVGKRNLGGYEGAGKSGVET